MTAPASAEDRHDTASEFERSLRRHLRRRLQLARTEGDEQWDSDFVRSVLAAAELHHLARVADQVKLAAPGSVAVVVLPDSAGPGELREIAERLNAWAEGRNVVVVTSGHEVRIEPAAETVATAGGTEPETEPAAGDVKPPATGRRTGTQAKRTAARTA